MTQRMSFIFEKEFGFGLLDQTGSTDFGANHLIMIAQGLSSRK